MSDRIFIADKATLDEVKQMINQRMNTDMSTRQIQVVTEQEMDTLIDRVDGKISDLQPNAGLTNYHVGLIENVYQNKQNDWDATPDHAVWIKTTHDTASELFTKTNGLIHAVGVNADESSESGSVHGKLKDIKAQLLSNASGIKSVQRGSVSASALSVGQSIGEIDRSRAFVIVQCVGNNTAAAQLINDTTLMFYFQSVGAGTAYWQVIEFH